MTEMRTVPISLNALLMLGDADLHDLHTALSEDVECSWAVADLDSGGLRDVMAVPADARVAVSIRRRSPVTPTWKPFLAGLGVPVDLASGPDAESVLIAVRTASDPPRTVLWCFGSASLAVPNHLVDGRFGLITALNKHTAGASIDSWRMMPSDARSRRRTGDPAARVRQLSAVVRDGYRHSVLAKSPAASPVQGLRFDSASDLLRGVRVSTQDELMPDLEGARGLKFSTYVAGWSDLAVLADHLVSLRNRTDYRREWEWVDHVVPVAPRAEVERLLGVLHQIVVEDSDALVDLVLPELGGDEPMPRLQFRMGREKAWSSPLEWRHVRRRLLQAPAGTSAALRRKIRIKSAAAIDSAAVEFAVNDLIAAEFTHDQKQYVLGDGELLVVDADFLRRLAAVLSDVVWSDFPFPAFLGGNEPDYLATAAERSRHRLALLDDQPIRLPGQTPFEACDLISDDGRLVFAKQKGRSSTFSHLCTQAEVAAEMFLRHGPARDQLLDRVAACRAGPALESAAEDAMAALESRQPDAVTITLLLLGSWRKRDVATLPLVSRIRMQRAADRIASLGYRFEVASPDLVAAGSHR